MEENYKAELITIIRNEPWLMEALEQVRELNLPDWFIAAGAIRNTIWDILHSYSERHIKDIDVVYFNLNDLGENKDRVAEQKLFVKNGKLKWEVFNQARADLYNTKRPKPTSSCDSIGYYSETPTCVGVRLEEGGSLTICAEYGLADLMNLIVRPIPKPKQDLELYAERVASKQWQEIWPKLEIHQTNP